MADIIIITVIFGYAGYALYRGIKKSKKGACASCSARKSCSVACNSSSSPTAKSKH